jgi:hypothetical protein
LDAVSNDVDAVSDGTSTEEWDDPA